MKKLFIILLILSIISTVTVGCSDRLTDGEQKNEKEISDKNTDGQIDTELSDKEKENNRLKTIHGEYLGQIDNHSIEINVENETKAFSIIEVISIIGEFNLQEGDRIIFSYLEGDNGQLIIKEMEKANQQSEAIKYTEGTYLGQIDSHSVEIKVNEIARAYQILEVKEQFAALNLNEGNKIKFLFIEKEDNVLAITNIGD